jgi:ribosomal subunit interface protein
MNIQVFVRGVEQPADLRSFAQEKLTSVLERFNHSVHNATLRLEDVTGPEKGGVDKACSVEVRLRTGEIRIKERGDDFQATINAAMDRLRAALSREVARGKRGVGEG